MRVPHVTINGASIGGLATALALHSKNLVPNLHINILDKNPYGNDGVGHGAGLNLQPHAVKMLDEIGLMEEVVASGWAPMNQQYFTNNGRLILNHPRGLNANPHGYPQVSIQQATLHDILERAVEDRLGPDVIKRGLEGLSYTQDEGGVNFVCKDTEGNRFNICTDAVIVADVLHSGMRKAVRQVHDNSESGLIKSGLNIYRGTALVDKVLDGHTVVRAGRSEGKLICYPLEAPKLVKNPDGSLGQKQMLNFVVEVSEESPPSGIFGSQDNLADHIASKLEGLNGDFRLPFLDHRKMLHEADFLKVSSMSVRDPLNAWCDGRVVLLGDAAHTMDLESSNVASSPFLDAAEIASVLEQKFNKSPLKSRQEICKPFQEYEEARLPTMVSVQQTFQEMLPEQVIDRVHNEVPGEGPIPKAYGECLLQALTKCQAGNKSGEKKTTKGLTTPAAFVNKNIVANFSPIERVLLAANGSLQRTISAMTNNDVVVKPVMTFQRSNQFLDREVTLHLGSEDGPCAVTCKTTVIPRNNDIKSRMLSQEIGIGQLVTERRKAGKGEPEFKLLACGKQRNGFLSRQYCLDFPGEASFMIHEEIDLDVLFQKALKIGVHKEACTNLEFLNKRKVNGSYLCIEGIESNVANLQRQTVRL